MVGDVSTAFGLTAEQQEYAAWVRSVARSLDDVPAVHGAVNRPLVKALGAAGLLRGLFGGAPDEPPRDAAAMQLCLLREMLATVNTEAETALALQGLGAYPILQSGNDATRERWIPGVAVGDVVPAFARGTSGRGPVDPPRHQDLDLQRPRRRCLRRLRPHHAPREGARHHGVRRRR